MLDVVAFGGDVARVVGCARQQRVQIAGAPAAFVKGVVMDVAKATIADFTTPGQRYGMSAIVSCADMNPDGCFVEKVFKAIIKCIDEP